MKSAIVAIALFSLTLVAHAEDTPVQHVQGPAPATAVDRCTSVLARVLDENFHVGEKYDQIQAALQQAQTRIKELEDKYEPKKPEPRNSEQNK